MTYKFLGNGKSVKDFCVALTKHRNIRLNFLYFYTEEDMNDVPPVKYDSLVWLVIHFIFSFQIWVVKC